ncbi:hypothetical protein ACIPT9_10280 [Pectobacterium carotovorum]|uniref:hypothetical protein n=1 Tax=Pectobacterium carotovorum TaxID=554 RepID=UPI0037F7A906
MARQLRKRSEIERMVATGEAIMEPPRQPIRETITGRIISNERIPEQLPTYLIGLQTNNIVYNDIDVEAFHREVRQQVSRILDTIRDERFSDAGIAYQQFIDLYDACFEMPSRDELNAVKRSGVMLYAVLEDQGSRLSSELSLKNQPSDEAEHRFNAVTEAHINLFFYMLTLNLALNNQIDSVQGQLRSKIGLLENRLRTLLSEYIYAGKNGWMPVNGVHASETLYGWILLMQNNLDDAQAIYLYDTNTNFTAEGFSHLHAQVFSVYLNAPSYREVSEIRSSAFFNRGMTNSRARIALRLCYYLQQTKQIRQYIDELTQGSDDQGTNEATVDIQSHLLPEGK